MNGFSTEEDSHSGGHDQVCCLTDSNRRCIRPAGNASYSKRIQKTVLQRKLRLARDDSVRVLRSLLVQKYKAIKGMHSHIFFFWL